jgi:hypothetical protein
METLFPSASSVSSNKKSSNKKTSTKEVKTNASLEEQIRRFLEMNDDEYQESKLTSELR